MIRLLSVLILLMLPATSLAGSAQTPERSFSDMPVQVLYCDQDPGRISPGGGKDPSPDSLVSSGECTPGEGVSLTFVLASDDWDFETDDPAEEIDWEVEDDAWFARCDMDAEGKCALESPQGFDIVIGVVLHENTVKPGYEPAFFQPVTHNFTEFAGYGLVLIPEDGYTGTATEVGDHQTLALSITSDGAPAEILTEWEFNDDDDTDIYLASNTDGWVSNVIAGGDHIEIDLMNVTDDTEISIGCSGVDDPYIDLEFDLDGNDLTIDIPETESDVRCDLVITG